MFYFKLKKDIKDSIAISKINYRNYTALRKVAITIDNRAEQRRKEFNRLNRNSVRTFSG
jgi:hypothetical protein